MQLFLKKLFFFYWISFIVLTIAELLSRYCKLVTVQHLSIVLGKEAYISRVDDERFASFLTGNHHHGNVQVKHFPCG